MWLKATLIFRLIFYISGLWAHLLVLADSNYVHGIPGFQVFSGIIYIGHFIAITLIEIVKCPWISKFKLFCILQLNGTFSRMYMVVI